VLRHDIPDVGPSSQTYPHIIIDNMSTTIGARVSRIIQALYPPVTKTDCRRVITFANRNDFVSFRHHMYNLNKGEVELKEAGPRFEMQPYEVLATSPCLSVADASLLPLAP
jgi:U3 small nucleolar ribonucleoprotein protein IMP4